MSSRSQVITCKGAICWGTGEEVKVEEIQVDPPKASEVRVKTLCASICHTDILRARGHPYGTGKAIAIGAGTEEFLQVNWLGLLFGRTLKGSIFGGLKPNSDLPLLATKCLNKDFPLDELLIHEVPLTEISKAFELLKQSDCDKVIIKM